MRVYVDGVRVSDADHCPHNKGLCRFQVSLLVEVQVRDEGDMTLVIKHMY